MQRCHRSPPDGTTRPACIVERSIMESPFHLSRDPRDAHEDTIKCRMAFHGWRGRWSPKCPAAPLLFQGSASELASTVKCGVLAGDGAGLLVAIPHQFFQSETDFELPPPDQYAIGQVVPTPSSRAVRASLVPTPRSSDQKRVAFGAHCHPPMGGAGTPASAGVGLVAACAETQTQRGLETDHEKSGPNLSPARRSVP